MGDAAHLGDLESYNYAHFDEHIAEGGEQEATAGSIIDIIMRTTRPRPARRC
jgi:hypothetical protein